MTGQGQKEERRAEGGGRDRGCEPREGWQLALQWGRGGVRGGGSGGVQVPRGLASTFFLQVIRGRWPPN